MEKSFRLIDSRQEIITLIEGCGLTEVGDIWQGLPVNRVIHSLSTVQIDHINGEIIFKTYEEIRLDKSQPIYVRLNNRGLIFKLHAKEFRITKNVLISIIPKVAKAHDMRKTQRFSLGENSSHFLVLKPFHKGANTLPTIVKLIDFSEKGFGIIINDMNKDFFIVNKNFWIESVNKSELPSGLVAEVSGMNMKVKGLKKGEIRIGMRLMEAMTKETMRTIQEELGMTQPS